MMISNYNYHYNYHYKFGVKLFYIIYYIRNSVVNYYMQVNRKPPPLVRQNAFIIDNIHIVM